MYPAGWRGWREWMGVWLWTLHCSQNSKAPPPPIYHVDAVEDIVVCPLVAEEEEEKGRKPKEFSKII